MTEEEINDNAADVILATVVDDATRDAFIAWYKPEQWLGKHRAVGAFLRQEMEALKADNDLLRKDLADPDCAPGVLCKQQEALRGELSRKVSALRVIGDSAAAILVLARSCAPVDPSATKAEPGL